MSNDTQVQALKELVDSAAPFVKLFQQADANRDQPMDGRSNIDAQIAVKDLRRLVYAADAARAAVEASARQLSEQGAPVAAQQRFRHPQKGTPGWSVWQPCEVRNRPAWEIDSQGYEVEYRALCVLAARPLTASPTAPSTEASDPVGGREAFEAHWYDFYHAGSIQADADGTYWPKEVQCAWQAWQAARTTSPPAPVLSDAEIDAIGFEQWGNQIGAMKAAYRAYARAIEQAIGRASRGAK